MIGRNKRQYTMLYILGMFSIGIFAITSIISTQNKNIDIFSAILLAAITALGGGTVRDVILGQYPVFWMKDLLYLWVTIGTAFVAFFIVQALQNRYQLLLYLDALATALFSIVAANTVLTLGFSAPIAIVMGLITAIVGGILRDLLTGHPSILMRKEMYATPILLGLISYIILGAFLTTSVFNVPLCIAITFSLRSCAIYYQWRYPAWLCSR